MKSVFYVPVYNEIDRFPALLEELRGGELACDDILLVNSGSTDGCEELIRKAGLPYIDIPTNQGANLTYIKAVDWALENGYDVLGTLAGNGKMLPSEMPRLLDPVLQGKADYVSGSRFLPGGSFPNIRRFRQHSIPMVNRFVQLLTGVKLTDATCGYRCWRLDIIRRARFDWHAKWLWSYGLEYYLYAKVLLDGGFRSIEVPVTMRYPPRGQRCSKIPPIVGWYQMLKPWVIARFDRRGFEPDAAISGGIADEVFIDRTEDTRGSRIMS